MTAVSAPRPGWELLAAPGQVNQRRYEALRATQFGVGPVTSVAIWAELGDVRRFANADFRSGKSAPRGAGTERAREQGFGHGPAI